MKRSKMESISIQLTGKQLTLLISGIFLISVLSFVFGAIIIKRFKPDENIKVADNKEKKAAAGDIKQKIEKRIAGISNDTLTFFDTLPDRDKAPNKRIVSAAEQAVKPHKESPKASEAKTPPPLLPAAEKKRTGKYAIQVVSYRNKGDSQHLKSILVRKGYDAYITEADIPKKGVFYRVRIGDYKDKTEASKIAKAFFLREAKELKISRPLVTLR